MKPAQPLRLHRHPLSGHSHRVELLLSLLGLPYELCHVDLLSGAQKKPDFLSKNVFGQVPVLEDGDVTLADSNAILIYLAERYDTDARFWPRSPEDRAAVVRWLSVAAGQLSSGPGAARLVRVFGSKLDHGRAVQIAEQLFGLLEAELSKRSYLALATPSLADVALYAYVKHAPEGDVSLEPYPAVRAWLTRVEALPGFVPMTSASAAA
jgi:glutathione S-transferase